MIQTYLPTFSDDYQHQDRFEGSQEFDYLVGIINKLNLPKVSQINHETLLSHINKDKKKRNGIIQFILLNKLGNPIINKDVSEDLILKSIKVLK